MKQIFKVITLSVSLLYSLLFTCYSRVDDGFIYESAGNTWGEDSRYRVWIPQTLNVMGTDYKRY